jgi:hypothetical protein
MASEFDANAEKEVQLYKKYKFPYSYNVYTTDDYLYYFVIRLENFADFDKMYQAFSELKKAAGEEAKDVSKGFLGTYDYYTVRLLWYMPELSYLPETYVDGYEDFTFLEWNFAYIEKGTEEAFMEVCKEWVDLYKKYDVNRPFFTFRGDIGIEAPMFLWTIWGKNHIEYFTYGKKNNELMGEESGPLWEKTVDMFRKFESKTGYLRESLSYQVAEE